MTRDHRWLGRVRIHREDLELGKPRVYVEVITYKKTIEINSDRDFPGNSNTQKLRYRFPRRCTSPNRLQSHFFKESDS
jgi:hypothetical protein